MPPTRVDSPTRHVARRVQRGLLSSVLVLLLLTASPTAADPIKGTHKEVFPVTCAGQTYEVAAGRGVAAQVVGDTSVLIPAEFVQVSSWVDPATGELVTA